MSWWVLILHDPVTNCQNQVYFKADSDDPFVTAVEIDLLALRYSELMINSAQIAFIINTPDKIRTLPNFGEEYDLPGAILPTTNAGFTTHSSCFYYTTVTP